MWLVKYFLVLAEESRSRSMARRRTTAFILLLLLLSLSSPFLFNGHNLAFRLQVSPNGLVNLPPPLLYSNEANHVQQLFFSPTFPLHLLWITVLFSLFLVCIADLLLKVVYVCCTFGVASITKHRAHTRFVLQLSKGNIWFAITFLFIFSRKTDLKWTVFVQSIHSEVISISGITAKSKVSTIYSMVSARIGIPGEKIRIMRGRKLLQPYNSLHESDVENRSTLNLHIPIYGGGKGNSKKKLNYFIIIILLFCRCRCLLQKLWQYM